MKDYDTRGLTALNSTRITVGPRGDYKRGLTTRALIAYDGYIHQAEILYRRNQAHEFYRALYAAWRSGQFSTREIEDAVELTAKTIVRKLKGQSPITERMFVFQYCLLECNGYWMEEYPEGKEVLLLHRKKPRRGDK